LDNKDGSITRFIDTALSKIRFRAFWFWAFIRISGFGFISMPTPHLILFGLVLPAAIAGVLALLGGWFFPEIHWGATLGLCGGLVVAYWGIADIWPPMPPIEAPERIVVFGAVLGIAAIGASWRKVPWIVRVILAIIAPAAMVWYLFKPIPVESMPVAQMWEWVAVASGIALVINASTEAIAIHRPGPAAALGLGPTAAGIGAILLMVGTIKLGWLGAAIALMVLGWFAASLISKNISLSRGPVYVVVTLLTGLLTYDYFESGNITVAQAALVSMAPFLAWIVELPPMRKWSAWKRELLRMVIVFIPIGIAVGMAVVQFRKDAAAE
jgi:hypothetical protein